MASVCENAGMTVPGIVQSTLEGEEIATRVSLGDDDELFITPSRTLIYRASGLLSDESVDEFAHDADRLTLSEGRRKTKFVLEYPLEGTRSFTIPASRTDEALHPVLAGILNGNGITDPGETVVQTFRFSELTLILTSDRVVKHIGSAVWDTDCEQYHYDDVTNLSFEDGSVATQVVLETDGRQQRVKAPNDRADEVAERLKRALFAHHDVDSLEELNALLGPDEAEDEASGSTVDFGVGVDPLDANPPSPDEDVESGADDPLETNPLGAPASATEDEADSTDNAETRRPDSIVANERASPAADAEADGDFGGAETGVTEATPGDESQASRASSSQTGETGPVATDETSLDHQAGGEPTGAKATTTATGADRSSPEAAAGDDLTSPSGDHSGQSEERDGFEDGPFTPATDHQADPALLERIESLEAAVDAQREMIEAQQSTIEQLIEELRRGR